MVNSFADSFSPLVADPVTEELVAVLSSDASFEFNPLFDLLHSNLRAVNAVGTGKAALRLRAQEVLKNLVERGMVEKSGTRYRGNASLAFESTPAVEPAPIRFNADQIAEMIRGEAVGDGATTLTGFSSAEVARDGDLTFADTEAHFLAANRSAASAILVPLDFVDSAKVLIRVPNVRIAVARLLPLFFPPAKHPEGIHASATIDASAQVDPSAHIGPNCIVGAGVRIGARSVLMGGNQIGPDSQIGEDVCLFPNVVVYAATVIGDRVSIHAGTTIGSDGYGYVFDAGHHLKVLQVGNVVIHDDVEVGANCAIDRGALGATVIGAGTKIDNLVHVAHNVVMGAHCLVMGQVGFAGSTQLGDYTVIASQSGIGGHLKLGKQSTVGAKSGVMRDIPDGGTVLGIPAMPDKQTKRQWIALQQLPQMIRQMRDLEKQVTELKAKLETA